MSCQDSEAQLGPRVAAGARDLPANIQPKFRSTNLFCWPVQKNEAVSQHLGWNHFIMSLTNGRTWHINRSFCMFLPFGYILEARNLQITASDLCSDCLKHPASSMWDHGLSFCPVTGLKTDLKGRSSSGKARESMTSAFSSSMVIKDFM